MTRVSVGFSHQLCDKHLNKERIEVLRIPNKIKAEKYKSKPTEYDRQIVRERITERLKSMSNLRYNREPITVEEAIKKLEE